MDELDRIFAHSYSAVDLFTDRLSENTAFAQALENHEARVADGLAALDVPARRNVLVYFGIGGIGKTELSRRLERWMLGELPASDWGEPPRFERRPATARLDFHGATAVDAADLVLRLRTALAARRTRFPAFDLGLTAWWALAHPGSPLPELRTTSGFDVREQIIDTLNDIASDAGLRFGVGPLSVRMGVRLVDAIRSRALRSRTLRECAPLAALVERARQDASTEVAAALAGLLNWDLDRLDRSRAPLPVVFADAVEYVQGGSRVQERLLNRIVHLTPGVLWVITSRNSLEWADERLIGTLAAAGSQTWPGLRLTTHADPCQHRVGDLSDADVERFLRTASGAGGLPALPPEVTARIRQGAHGLPLYLDLSLAIARTSATTGAPLDPASFGGSLPELATRVFADLPAEERTAARTASLLPRFDPELIAEASGSIVGDATRLCARPLVSRDDHATFPYRLHDAVRDAVAEEPVDRPGAWAPADRADRARHVLDALRERHAGARADVPRRRDILELAAQLCDAQNLEAPWLLDALLELPGLEYVAARLPPPDARTWIGQLSRFFGAWRDRSGWERMDYLRQLLAAPLPPDIEYAARRFLAYGYRSFTDQFEESAAIFEELLAQSPGSALLRFQVGHTLHMMGAYDAMAAHFERYPLVRPEALARVEADLAYDRGDLLLSAERIHTRAQVQHDLGRHRQALENDGAVLWRLALAGATSPAECDRVIDEADRLGSRPAIRAGLGAKIVCLRGDDAATGLLRELIEIARGGDARRAGWREWITALLHGLCRQDQALIDTVRDEWTSQAPRLTPNRRIVDRLFVFAGYPPAYPDAGLGSDVDDAAAGERWNAVFTALVRHDPAAPNG